MPEWEIARSCGQDNLKRAAITSAASSAPRSTTMSGAATTYESNAGVVKEARSFSPNAFSPKAFSPNAARREC
jgi:hypothetical protein